MIVKLKKYKITRKFSMNDIIKIYLTELSEHERYMVSSMILGFAEKV